MIKATSVNGVEVIGFTPEAASKARRPPEKRPQKSSSTFDGRGQTKDTSRSEYKHIQYSFMRSKEMSLVLILLMPGVSRHHVDINEKFYFI